MGIRAGFACTTRSKPQGDVVDKNGHSCSLVTSPDLSSDLSPPKLALLLPLTSRPGAAGPHHPEPLLAGIERLAASLASPASPSMLALIGIDSDDSMLLEQQDRILELFTAAGVPSKLVQFTEADRQGLEPGAVCVLWGLLAKLAVKEGCSLAVLLGDDTEVQPAGWPALVLSAFADDPQLMLLLLNDKADPGFPSFPVLQVDRHLQLFEDLLPPCFVNQGGDPYLAALYRRWHGCIRMLPEVTVHNSIGGVQRSDQPYTQPRYTRLTVSKQQMLLELRLATQQLEATAAAAAEGSQGTGAGAEAQPAAAPAGSLVVSGGDHSSSSSSSSRVTASLSQRQLAVDVLVPTFRVDLELLAGIEEAVLCKPCPPGSDLRLIIVIDRPRAELSSEQLVWLHQLQDRWLHRVRLRFNETNLGASATRNRGLQESTAEFVVMWDDDICPSEGCLAAYVNAFKQHPQALGFAGPSFIPKDPKSLWCCAVHQADVLFFWDAAQDWQVAEVMPWAVTANVAFVNTPTMFDLRFPATGGGEDIDYCLRAAAGRLVPVPQASVTHPLWSNGRRCYGRFFGWAFGDGALIPMYPQLCYWTAPNSTEVCGCLLLLAAAGAGVALGLAAAAQAGRALALLGAQEPGVAAAAAAQAGTVAVAVWCLSAVMVAAAGAFKLTDTLLDVGRAFTQERVTKHPCRSPWLRIAAAAEASLFIKTWSEVGRLWGLISRGELTQGGAVVVMCRRFNWFCGLSAEVVAAEQRRAAVRFAVCSVVAAVAGAAAAGIRLL